VKVYTCCCKICWNLRIGTSQFDDQKE